MVGLNPIFLERSDLHYGKKEKLIEEVSYHDFNISKEQIRNSGLIIFFDSDSSKCKVLKSKYDLV